jgi:hypothetical protein
MGLSDAGFQVLKQIVPQNICEIATNYALMQEKLHPELIRDDGNVANTFATYGDPLMESLLAYITPQICEASNLRLVPTYSYYRVYRNQATLPEHTDRVACQYSITLCLGKSADMPDWEITMNGHPIYLNVGDAALYLGCDVVHARPTLQASDTAYQIQSFLHWVDSDGPYAKYVYDTRPSLGLPHYMKKLRG